MPFADNKGVKIHYEVEGQGPPLLLGHGFGGTWKTWVDRGFVRDLSKDYRLVMLDTRGCGVSDKPHDEKAYDFRLLVGDLVAILDDLEIQKANYFGYSMGGRVGYRIPMYAPERFNSLILGGSVYPILGTEDANDDLLISIQQYLEKGFEEAPDKPMEVYLAEMEKQVGPRPPEMQASILANDPFALTAAIHAFRGMRSPKSDEVLPYVKIPCLLFVGEADPRFPGVKECANRIPNATFFSLPGLNHVQAAASSDLISPHIKKFLAEVNN